MKVELEKITEEEAGRFTAYVRIVDDSGTVLKKTAVQGTSAGQIGVEVRRKLQKYKYSLQPTEARKEEVRKVLAAINSEEAAK